MKNKSAQNVQRKDKIVASVANFRLFAIEPAQQ